MSAPFPKRRPRIEISYFLTALAPIAVVLLWPSMPPEREALPPIQLQAPVIRYVRTPPSGQDPTLIALPHRHPARAGGPAQANEDSTITRLRSDIQPAYLEATLPPPAIGPRAPDALPRSAQAALNVSIPLPASDASSPPRTDPMRSELMITPLGPLDGRAVQTPDVPAAWVATNAAAWSLELAVEIEADGRVISVVPVHPIVGVLDVDTACAFAYRLRFAVAETAQRGRVRLAVPSAKE